jgi:glycine hydroxymethyltransferase
MKYLKKTDREIAKLIKAEEKRQAETLMLIPSENLASKAVEEAVGSVLANKYAEGYPFRRYYQGQENVDQIESLAMSRPKNCSVFLMSMFSRIPDRRPIQRFILLF